MSKLKQELEFLKTMPKKQDNPKYKEELCDEIIMFIYKCMKVNGWEIEQVYDHLQIKDIFQLRELDEERLEGILAIIQWAFAENGKYLIF